MKLIHRITDWFYARRNRDQMTSLSQEVTAIQIEHRCMTIPQQIIVANSEIARQVDACWSLLCQHNPVPGAPCYEFAMYDGFCLRHKLDVHHELKTECDTVRAA